MSARDTKLTTYYPRLLVSAWQVFDRDKHPSKRNTRKDQTEEDSQRKICEFHGFIAAPTTNLFNDKTSTCLTV